MDTATPERKANSITRATPPKIALTGGIATGKSTVSKMLQAKGAYIIDADKIAREIVRPGTQCWKKLKEVLPQDYFDTAGNIKRAELRKAIVQNPELRSIINTITHPEIIRKMESQWTEQITKNPWQITIFDIPLLFESRLHDRFDLVILVYAPPEIQVQRLIHRDGLNHEEAKKTLTMQMPIEKKKQLASLIIDNSSSIENLNQHVEKLWTQLKKLWYSNY